MATHTDIEQFLQELHPGWPQRAFYAQDTPGRVWSETRDVRALQATNACYVSIATFDPACKRRLVAEALEVVVLVIDDVGSAANSVVTEDAVRLGIGLPTKIILSSPGNHQWYYRLSAPIPVDEWPRFFAGVKMLIGTGTLHGPEAHHVFRVPFGINVKPEHGGFPVQELVGNPGITLDVASIPRIGPLKSKAPAVGGGADIKLGLDDLRICMSWIKNDAAFDERNGDYINIIGHGLKALCKNDVDGFTVYDEWSEPHPKHDSALIRKAWGSFGARGLESRGGKLKGLWQKANPEGFAKMFAPKVFDDGAVPPKVPPGKGRVKFLRGEKKQILSMMENAKRAVTGLGLVCRYDEFHHRAFIERQDGTVTRVDDKFVLMLRDEITAAYGKEFSIVHVGEAVMTLAYLSGFNPVVEMLAAAERDWDGVKRLDRLGPDYFHTEDSELARRCVRKVMLAAVRRARRPGCKFDTILVLESPEGWDKSTAWRVLAGDENFSDADILSKDAKAVQEELADIWIHEIADLAGLSKADVDHVKSFASRMNDRARPAYGRFLLDQPRQSIEIGTTNAQAYLASITGNRRFWPFELLSPVDMAALRRDRLQLWGEAAAAESGGEALELDKALWDDAAAAQEERRVVDPWEDELDNLPDHLIKEVTELGVVFQTITNTAIYDHLGGHRGGKLNGSSGRTIRGIMKRLGWDKGPLKDALGKKVRGYKRRGTDATVSVPTSVPENPF